MLRNLTSLVAMGHDSIEYIHAGLLSYPEATELQETLWNARQMGDIPDTLVFLQYLPVVTFGPNNRESSFTLESNALQKMGIEYYQLNQGGCRPHYYAPGQVMIYPVFALQSLSLKTFTWKLEETAIRLLADWGIRAQRSELDRGLWVNGKKIASVSLLEREGVTVRGLLLNVNNDLKPLEILPSLWVPDRNLTSMKAVLGKAVTVGEVETGFLMTASSVFNRPVGRSTRFTFAEAAYRRMER